MTAFSVATYNVLATAYIRPQFYPHTPVDVLSPAYRVPALCRAVASLATDVICLQEVENDAYAALTAHLVPLGYCGEIAAKTGKPDGCATFLRSSHFPVTHAERFVFADDSGHVALVTHFERDGRQIAIANTHLKWDPPAAQNPIGLRQIAQLADALAGGAAIICGDFNATPGSAVIAALHQRGFHAAHEALPRAFTCNSNRVAKVIDYLCATPQLSAAPAPVAPIDGETPLPSREQPSDHLPLVASFDWAAA